MMKFWMDRYRILTYSTRNNKYYLRAPLNFHSQMIQYKDLMSLSLGDVRINEFILNRGYEI